MKLIKTTFLIISLQVVMVTLAGCSSNNSSAAHGKAHFTPGPGIPPGMLAKANAYMRAKQQGGVK